MWSLNGRNNIHVHVAGVAATNGEVVSSEDPSAPKNLSMDGAEWVELFVREMMSASNMDDARARASRALEVLEKSICARASAEAAQSFHQVVYLLLLLLLLLLSTRCRMHVSIISIIFVVLLMVCLIIGKLDAEGTSGSSASGEHNSLAGCVYSA